MYVYMIIDIKVVKDPDTYNQYIEKVKPIVERFGGKYLARGGKVMPLGGAWHPERVTVIRFPCKADLEKCFGAKEYREIAHLRDCSTECRSIMVEGLE